MILPPFPSRLCLAHLPTPLRKLNYYSRKYNLNIWLKSDDQTGFVMSGNKVRKLEFLLADAKKQEAKVIITSGGVQSNHCRATAFACAQLGLKCHLILRNDPHFRGASSEGQANHFLDQLCGATFELHNPEVYGASISDLFANAGSRFQAQGLKPYCIPTGGSNGLGLWGYIKAFHELAQQCATHHFKPDVIVSATGSGGTQAGLTVANFFSHAPSIIQAFAVCDDARYFDSKVRTDAREWAEFSDVQPEVIDQMVKSLDVHTNDNYIGPGYAKGYPELYSCISDVASREGVLFDPTYTGKAFYGLLTGLELARFPKAKNIVFVHTGGGFGIFPHTEKFL